MNSISFAVNGCLKRGDAVLREALCSRGEQPCSAGWSGCRRSVTGFAPSIGRVCAMAI
jgi:hypothetical protein